jgi:hypothetical protein
MRLLSFAPGLLLAAAALLAGPGERPAPTASVPVVAAPAAIWPADDAPPGMARDDLLLPLKIPGYELRTLDVRKPVLFNVNGTWVQASLPIFFYAPSPVPPQAGPVLRRVYDELLRLGQKPEWTAAELQGLIDSVDTALGLLGERAPAGRPKSAG